MPKVLHHTVQWMKKNKKDQTFLKITQTCYIVWVKLIFKHNIQYVSSGSSRLLVLFISNVKTCVPKTYNLHDIIADL